MAAQKKTRPKAWIDTGGEFGLLWKKVDGHWYRQACFHGDATCNPLHCALAAVNAESVWLCCGAGISYDRVVDKPFED